MTFFQGIFLIVLLSAVFIFFAGGRMKGVTAVASVVVLSLFTGFLSVRSLAGINTIEHLGGSLVTGEIPVILDPLAAWFILIIDFTFITGALYGARYMAVYQDEGPRLSLHWISYLLAQASLILVCVVQNSLVFLMVWEVMALSTFILVIFDGRKEKTIKAGINYLIQSHVAVLFLTIAFIWVYTVQDSTGFDAIHQFAVGQKPVSSLILMMLFFVGFGFKSGFVPFHTWLPHAHPAAPSHVSGMMSGVLIKIGIYGILRMILLIDVNYSAIGYIILLISILTGVYGVMLAIVQHNLKRLLAYHSIENIGIIGIGIGLGCIGLGNGNTLLASLGFAGALLHTLNHSLFKSVLFYSAGNIYQAYHTMNIERFGGIIRKMPQTAVLFLVAAVAICGLPPFNGFVSEFILYLGLLKGINSVDFPSVIVLVSGIFGLSIIGGLAIFCFTKAFGSVFLGVPRYPHDESLASDDRRKLFPMYMAVILIMAVGLFPQWFMRALSLPLGQFIPVAGNAVLNDYAGIFDTIGTIGFYSAGFLLLVVLIFFLRKGLTRQLPVTTGPTWGCGYVAPSPKMQYTASSFVRNYRKLAGPLLILHREKKEVEGIFPGEAAHRTHPEDKTEVFLIGWPTEQFRNFLGRFSFLQNGKLQMYILYGMLFILILVALPFLIKLFNI